MIPTWLRRMFRFLRPGDGSERELRVAQIRTRRAVDRVDRLAERIRQDAELAERRLRPR